MDEPEDYFPSYSPFIQESAEKIDNFWKNLSKDLNPRIVPIVMDIGIQVYVDSLIHLQLNTTAIDRISFPVKIQILIDQGILGEGLGNTLRKLFEIRNICGHHIEINEKEIHNILDSLESNSNKEDQNYGLKYSGIASKAILNLGKIYDEAVSDSISI